VTTDDGPQKVPKKRSLKSYGRQSEGKTIKSLSLDKALVQRAEARAKELGISFSQFMNDMLAKANGLPPSSADTPAPTSKKPGKKGGANE